MLHFCYMHRDLNGIQYFATGLAGSERVPRVRRMGGFTVEHLGAYDTAEQAMEVAQLLAAGHYAPYLPGAGYHIECMVSRRIYPSVSHAAAGCNMTQARVMAMLGGKVWEDGPHRLRWMLSRNREPKPVLKRGRPLGGKNKPRVVEPKVKRTVGRPKGRKAGSMRTLGRPDTTGWPALTWDVLPHPSGYVAWRAAVRDCGGYALRHTAWFPSHAAADRFALSVAGG